MNYKDDRLLSDHASNDDTKRRQTVLHRYVRLPQITAVKQINYELFIYYAYCVLMIMIVK